jgi:hypothetical protein
VRLRLSLCPLHGDTAASAAAPATRATAFAC